MKNMYYNELVEILKDAAGHGAECYIYHNRVGDYLWGLILTENNNILYIQCDSYGFRGWTFTLKYEPSKNNGNGCQCLEEPLCEVTYDDILEAERQGLVFARKIGAKLYPDGRKALPKMYSFKDMKKVTKEGVSNG